MALAKRSERFTETPSDGEVVIMRLDTGQFFSLAGTAAAAWHLIDGERTRADLIAALSVEYASADGQLEKDLDEFLGQLKASGILVEA